MRKTLLYLRFALFLVLTVSCISLSWADEGEAGGSALDVSEWEEDLDAAIKQARDSGKLIFLYVLDSE